jgi:hypothetical protein
MEETMETKPSDSLREHLKAASEIVKSWPEWKRGILAGTTESMNTKPREVVEAVEHEDTTTNRSS